MKSVGISRAETHYESSFFDLYLKKEVAKIMRPQNCDKVDKKSTEATQKRNNSY